MTVVVASLESLAMRSDDRSDLVGREECLVFGMRRQRDQSLAAWLSVFRTEICSAEDSQ